MISVPSALRAPGQPIAPNSIASALPHAASVASGNAVPLWRKNCAPASYVVKRRVGPPHALCTASSNSRAAAVTSTPMPSPGRTAMSRILFVLQLRFLYRLHRYTPHAGNGPPQRGATITAPLRILEVYEALGVIGNCQFSALIHNSGEIVWCCLPRLDSDPVFSTLLDRENGGRFRVSPADGEAGQQRYIPHTNILETTFQTPTGSFRVIDFAPRFMQYGRAFRPAQLIRIVTGLIDGTAARFCHCEPKHGWAKTSPVVVEGSDHLNYRGLRQPSAAHVGYSALSLPRRQIRLPSPTRQHPAVELGRARGRAAHRALRTLLGRDRALLAGLGQAVRNPTPDVPETKSASLRLLLREAALLRRTPAPSSPR